MNVACTQCGTPSAPGNRFCGRCGTPLPPSPGNLPRSTQSGYAPPGVSPTGAAVSTPCWQCGTAVDPLRQPACPTCGASLGVPATAPATSVMAGPPQAGFGPPPSPFGPPSAAPGPPPPFAVTEPAPAPRSRREPLVSGVAITIVVAIGIVLVLAVVGIVAGQAIGR
jgi:hypothetical protein